MILAMLFIGSTLSFWPIQSSRGPVECLETMPKRDNKAKANDLSLEKTRQQPLDHAVVRILFYLYPLFILDWHVIG
jgi:hypothetical protein